MSRDYVKYEVNVVEVDPDDAAGRVIPLEIWASVEESPYVEYAVHGKRSYESVGFEPCEAIRLAEALARREPAEIQAIDDYDDSPAELQVSWDDEGADLLLILGDRGKRIVIDYDEQPDQIAQALAGCAAVLDGRG